MTQTEALKLALEALENWLEFDPENFGEVDKKAITAIKAALEAKDEPVACWCHKCNENELVNGIPFAMTRMILCPNCGNKRCPKASDHTLQCTNSNEPNQAGSVYTTPPQRTWVGLTDEDKASCVQATAKRGSTYELMAAIEAKLKEKNT